MSVFESAVWEIHQVLTELKLPYAIIGGTAVQYWGEPRFTKDIDLTVLAPLESFTETVELLLTRLNSRIDNALEFALRNRVLLVTTSNNYPTDISFGLPGYEEQVIDRAIEHQISPGKAVRLCSAEDLIIHKAIAGRVQDVQDIENVIARQGTRLDTVYILQWLEVFAQLLESDEVIQRFVQPWRKYYP
jgi:predicted nucleotidyltransferase